MKKIYPHYPKPLKNKLSQFMIFFKRNNSWLDGLYDRSYTMFMGEVRLPKLTIFIPNDPELIQRVLVNEVKLFPKHPLQHEMLRPLLGNSIFTTNNKVWKKQRELLNPSFEMVRIAHVFNLMDDAAKDMLVRLEKWDENRYQDIDEEMTFITADIIFRTILSKKLSKEEATKIVDSFVIFQEKSAKYSLLQMYFFGKIFKFLGGDKARLKRGQIIRNALGKIIKPRYEAMINNQESDHKDILSSLLKVIDEDTGKPFSLEEILDQVAMLFLAGHETTASSMTWALYLLALYPEQQEKAYQEVLTLCGEEEFSAENTKKLSFVTNVFKETLRLYPPVSAFPRESKIKTTMRNKKLKKGATVIILPWLMHRNERYWEDAHMFNPHRFDDPKSIIKNTYFPFGLGQRICIGAGFAMQESVLLLATILREYRLELKEGFTPEIAGRLTTRSLNGMPIKLIKRTKILRRV